MMQDVVQNLTVNKPSQIPREASMLFLQLLLLIPGIGLKAYNGARVEWLNSFVYFAHKAIVGENGVNGLKGTGKTKIKLSGLVGTPTATETFTYVDSNGQNVNATVSSVDGDYIFLNGNVAGLETKYSNVVAKLLF